MIELFDAFSFTKPIYLYLHVFPVAVALPVLPSFPPAY